MACDRLGRCCFRIYGLPPFHIPETCTRNLPFSHESNRSACTKVPRIFIFKCSFFRHFWISHTIFVGNIPCWLSVRVRHTDGNGGTDELLTAVWKLQWKRCTKLNCVDKIKDFVVAVRAHVQYWFRYTIARTTGAYTIHIPSTYIRRGNIFLSILFFVGSDSWLVLWPLRLTSKLRKLFRDTFEFSRAVLVLAVP